MNSTSSIPPPVVAGCTSATNPGQSRIVAFAGINAHRPAPKGRPVRFALQDGSETLLVLRPYDDLHPRFSLMSAEDRATLAFWLHPRHWLPSTSRN